MPKPKAKKIPERMCFICRGRFAKTELIRFWQQGEQWLVDHSGKLNVRGTYICHSQNCLQQLLQGAKKARQFKLTEQDRTYLASLDLTRARDGQEKAYRLLGLARKSGKLIAGNDAVEIALGQNELKLVIIAEDSSAKLAAKYRSRLAAQAVPYLVLGSKNELGQRIGRAATAVCGVSDSNLAEGIVAAVRQAD